MYEITLGELTFLLDTIKEVKEEGSAALFELEQCEDLIDFILTKKTKEVV